jgi:cell division protein FtsN
MTGLISGERTKATWLTGAAGLLILAAAFVMMVMAAPVQSHHHAAASPTTQTTMLAVTQPVTDPMVKEQSLTQWSKPHDLGDRRHRQRRQ